MLRLRAKALLILTAITLLLLYFAIPTTHNKQDNTNPHFIAKLNLDNDIETSLDAKCSLFVETYIENDISYLHHSDYVFEESLQHYLSKQSLKFPNYSQLQYNSWINDYNDHLNSYLEIERNLINQTIDTRIFNNCFLQPDYIELNNTHCNIIQQNLFPWLTFKFPTINKFDGSEFSLTNSNCFIQDLYKQSSGKGIVLTAKNSHFQQLSSLFLSLRIINNTLPIQIIHKGDLSKSRQLQLIRLARLDLNKLFLEGEGENNEIIKFLKSQPNYNQTNYNSSSYPKLDISFINIAPSINKDYRKFFKTYSNKLLATLFTTFKEIIIMDTDVILFHTPESLFNIIEYRETGAFFFKDRQLINKSSSKDVQFWKKLLPTIEEHKFNNKIELISSNSISNRYFKGFTHLVESGIVIMDRSNHFGGILHSLQLSLWKTATKRVWGDKEFFWLSQLISGTQSFAFNSNFAGAIGEIDYINFPSPLPNPSNGNGNQNSNANGNHNQNINQLKICSNQPAHIYNNTLLWINSGFKFCKNGAGGFKNDLKFFPNFEMSQLITKYKNPINATSVIIPPDIDDSYLHWSQEINEMDPMERIQGWYNTPMCGGYTYCAVDKQLIKNKIHYGKIINFNHQESIDFNYLGTIWLYANSLQKMIDKNRKNLINYLDVDIK